jgi:hypothetical protein
VEKVRDPLLQGHAFQHHNLVHNCLAMGYKKVLLFRVMQQAVAPELKMVFCERADGL